ncbi:MAG: hypothetical protein J2P37_28980, partial [Ktedonobacteraceae bacterium]|nr:hypothetical protein [Ktedonobacteraceae bacterium]
DPHGDLCDHILHVVPPERTDDIVLIDLSERDGSVGINPLDVTLGRGRDKAVSDLMKTFSHIWQEAWGPRMENAFEMALRTLFEANKLIVAQDSEKGPLRQYTLLDVLPILTNESFCHALLRQIHDDYLHRWWRDYYEPLTLMQQREVVNPVLSKVTKFESEIARRIIGQSVSTINFTQIIEQRQILLVKLAKGVVGADIAAIVGASLLGLMQITLEEQGNKLEEERARLPIMLDEFQVLAGVDYAALAELRKYGATFFLATQSLEYLQKLDEVLLPTVLANVRQFLIFNMSAQDAETLAPELGVEPEDILHLDPHMCYVKMATGEQRQPVFSLKLLPPSKGDTALAESIRARCRVRYTRRAAEVDEMLQAAMIQSVRLISRENSEDECPGDPAEPEQSSPPASPSTAPPASELPAPPVVEQNKPNGSVRSEQVMTIPSEWPRTEIERAENTQVAAEHDHEVPPPGKHEITRHRQTETEATATENESKAEVIPVQDESGTTTAPSEPEAVVAQRETGNREAPRKRMRGKRGARKNKKRQRITEADLPTVETNNGMVDPVDRRRSEEIHLEEDDDRTEKRVAVKKPG